MSTVKKLAVFVVMVSAVIAAERAWLNAVQPQIATQVAIGQLQGNDNAFRELPLFETYKGVAEVALVMIALAIAWWLVRQPRRSSRRDWPQLILISTMSIFAMTGCISFVRSAGVRRDRYIGNEIPYSIGRQHRHAGAISIGRISARIERRGETSADHAPLVAGRAIA
jgi:hypothetical protein